MSDIWSMGGSDDEGVVQAQASDDWACSSSDSDQEERPRKRAKKASNNSRRPKRACVDIDLSQPKEQDAADEEDDLLAAYLSPPADTNAKGKAGRAGGGKGGKQRSPSPLLVDGDLAGLAGTSPAAAADATVRPAAGAGRSKAKAAAAAGGDPSPDPVRVAALQQRALREQLAQATHAAEEEDDEEIELLSSDDGPALPRPPGLDLTGADDPEDPALLLESLGASQPDPAAAAGAGGEGDRLPLVFQAQGHDKVTVRVQPHQPLSHGMDMFTKYATEKGWGRVVKFMFDGEKLSGEDTPEDLGIEAEEVIDVYLEA